MSKDLTVRYCRMMCLTGLLICAGCKSAGNRTSISITMLPDSRCTVAGRTIAPDRLDRALKSAGAGTGTRIRIALPDGASEDSIKQLARRLSSAGYRMIHFETPRKATAYIAPDKSPSGAPARQR